MTTRTALNKAVKLRGKRGLARDLGLAYQSMSRWSDQNRLPDTDYSGRTQYALKIEEVTSGAVTVEMLLGWRPNWPTRKKV
jgi:hypothetical protein